MFGGLTKTSSRIAIAAACGLLVGGFAFKATPALAADLGGDCCADLEERVAELEATTVRKGNKKVSVTLSGWVIKTMNWWDDGKIDHFVVGDKDYDLGTRFAITGSAQIAPGWSAGYNLTINTQGDVFGTGNQYNDLAVGTGNSRDYSGIATLYSYIYIKSDTLGTLNWGHLSPASDNPAVLADLSGTVIESNSVIFEGAGMFLRPKGNAVLQGGGNPTGLNTLSSLAWGSFLTCQGLGAGIGTDCWGVAQPAVRYDSPTWGGFRFETSYGKNQLTGPGLTGTWENGYPNYANVDIDTSDTGFWDIAVFYTGDWNSIKLQVNAAYTWIETGAVSVGGNECDLSGLDPKADDCGGGSSTDLFQIGASMMHKPSGLGVYGMYQHESTGGRVYSDTPYGGATQFVGIPDSDAWYIKPFWRKAWSPLGATVIYGEYGQYNDQFGGLVGQDLSYASLLPNACDVAAASSGCFVTGSEVERWGLGVVQEIDSAAMHVYARWQQMSLDVDVTRYNGKVTNGSERFDDLQLFQAGGIIFF